MLELKDEFNYFEKIEYNLENIHYVIKEFRSLIDGFKPPVINFNNLDQQWDACNKKLNGVLNDWLKSSENDYFKKVKGLIQSTPSTQLLTVPTANSEIIENIIAEPTIDTSFHQGMPVRQINPQQQNQNSS